MNWIGREKCRQSHCRRTDDVLAGSGASFITAALMRKMVSVPEPIVAVRDSNAATLQQGPRPSADRPYPTSLPIPPGATYEQVAPGDRIFHGETVAGPWAPRHGWDARDSPQGPSLVNGPRAHGDRSLEAITKIIASGVSKPRNFSGAMPPSGGVPLSGSNVAAAAASVWAIGHFEGERGKETTYAR